MILEKFPVTQDELGKHDGELRWQIANARCFLIVPYYELSKGNRGDLRKVNKDSTCSVRLTTNRGICQDFVTKSLTKFPTQHGTPYISKLALPATRKFGSKGAGKMAHLGNAPPPRPKKGSGCSIVLQTACSWVLHRFAVVLSQFVTVLSKLATILSHFPSSRSLIFLVSWVTTFR